MTKTAVVSGAASGIGKRTIERLLAEGWTVWGLDIAPQVDEALAHNARFEYLPCNVADAQQVTDAFAKIRQKTNKLDALICSAGIIRTGKLEDHTPEDFEQMFKVNVMGTWLCIRGALDLLRQDSTTHDPSRVVVVGSISAIRSKVSGGLYGSSKAALHTLCSVMAAELAPDGVLVNVVAPGSVDTPMKIASSTGNYRTSSDSPLGRIAQADDVADIIEFFLGDSSKYLTGTVLPVDGGTRAAFVPSP